MSTNELVVQNPVGYMLDSIKSVSVLKPEDNLFLMENKEHLWKVMEKSYIWRTDAEKRSIISDSYKPTLHSKMSQSMAELKVQTDQAFYLAKAYEEKRLEMEELEIQLEGVQEEIGFLVGDGRPVNDRNLRTYQIQEKRYSMDIQFKQYELKQMEIQMHYRMEEIRGWKVIQDELIGKMQSEGMDDDAIWNKQSGEIEDLFFMFLNNLQGIRNSTDGGERNNLVALAVYGIQQAQQAGIYEKLLDRCTPIQIDSIGILKQIGAIPK